LVNTVHVHERADDVPVVTKFIIYDPMSLPANNVVAAEIFENANCCSDADRQQMATINILVQFYRALCCVTQGKKMKNG
jgi:hypothetical protein